MSTTRRIAKNTTLLFVSQLINYILFFFAFIYLARYLGAEEFGVISYALALCGILIIFCELGFSTLIVREVSRNKSLANKYSSNISLLKIFLSLFTFTLFILIVYIEKYPPNIADTIYLIGLYYIMLTFSNVYNSIFQAYEKMEFISIATIINSIILFSGVLIAISYQVNIVIFAFIFFISNLIVLLYYLMITSWKLYIPKLEFDWSFWTYLIKESLPFAMTSIFGVVAFQVDQVFLSLLSGNAAVGYYSVAYRLMQALMFIPSVYTISILPVFSRLHISSRKSLKFGYSKSFKYLTILGLPIAVGVTLLSKDIIILLYDSGFTPSIIVLQIVIWAIPIIFLNFLLSSTIASINKQHDTVKIIFFSMILNVILNLIFIPTYSYIAASIITVITELFVLIWYFRIMSVYGFNINLKVFLKPLIASVLMALFIIFVHINLILTIIIATIIYFVALILLKEFSEDEINLFKEIIHR